MSMSDGHTSFIRPDEFWRSLGLRAEQVVVHLGCGPGFYLIPAAKIVGKGGKAIGIDVLSHMLAETENRAARENLSEVVQTIRANLEAPKSNSVPDASADWVLVANILHQSNPAKILHEAARLVKPTGSVVIVDWDTAASPMGPPADVRIARADAVAAAEAQGLKAVRFFAPSPYHYGIVLSSAAA